MTPAEREVIAKAVKELDAEHYYRSQGDAVCGCGKPWPCTAARVADDLRRLLETP